MNQTEKPQNEDTDEPEVVEGEEPIEEPPPYDAAAVGRVAAQIEIRGVELLGAYFERADEAPLPGDGELAELTPTVGVGGVDWALSPDRMTLGCAINFGATFDDEPEPYELYARFRVLYALAEDAEVVDEDLNVFAHWNSVFNAWPYWREFLTSMLNRAQLPRFVVPVMGVPRVETPDPSFPDPSSGTLE